MGSEVSETTWIHEVVAFNTATQSTNRMHDDAVAKTFGFRGGLVPGVDVWAYATRPCVDRWGPAFLETGSIELRFAAPVYDGERVTALLGADGTLSVTGPDGVVRALGNAAVEATTDPPRSLGWAELPDPVPPAGPDTLRAGTTLGTLRFRFHAEPAIRYVHDVRDDHPCYADGTLSHPGFLARQANYVLSSSVRLGPWIHVSTRARHRGLVHDGDEVEVRGLVTDEREHKGHRFVDLAVEITASGRPVWSAEHTAIWRPRQEVREDQAR